jgi:DNA-directed RNA polymerase specialized sigma subunit
VNVHLEARDLESVGVEIEDDIVIPAAATEVRRLAAMRNEAERLRAQVAADTRRATAVLRRAGLSTRDVGEILGVSGARVAQIEREAAAR